MHERRIHRLNQNAVLRIIAAIRAIIHAEVHVDRVDAISLLQSLCRKHPGRQIAITSITHNKHDDCIFSRPRNAQCDLAGARR